MGSAEAAVTTPLHAALVEAARAARDEGMATAENHEDVRLILTIDAVIAAANATGERWSVNDIRDQFPVVSEGLVGARVKAASMRKPTEMVRVGWTPSTLQSTHAKDVAVWCGVPAIVAVGDADA
jgi:hypothetical protein